MCGLYCFRIFVTVLLFSWVDCKTVPNFVILFADDVGYGDFQSYGHPSQEKGGVDELAAEGLKFSQWYSASGLCSPSRAALLTGRYPIRSGVFGSLRVFRPQGIEGLPKSETTIAEELKSLGYKTGIVGKWHLGINEKTREDGNHLPHHHGFDYVGHMLPFTIVWYCGSKYNGTQAMSEYCFLAKGKDLVEQPIKLENLSERLRNDMVRFIMENQKQPFFLYVGLPQAHSKAFCSKKFCNTSKRGLYGDSINEMSWLVSETTETLKKLKLDKNTLVFFISDQGPEVEFCTEGGSTAGLRGHKASTWEGGFRVPSIAWWPGTIEAGSVNNDVYSTLDIYPTVLELAGGKPTTLLDGISLAPLFKRNKKATKKPVHDAIFYYCSEHLLAVRIGSYKIHYFTQIEREIDTCTNGIPHSMNYVFVSCLPNVAHDPPLIFNLDLDPFEKYPLDSSMYPELLEEAAQKVKEHKDSIVPVPSQVDKVDPSVQPCCNFPSCSCDYPSLSQAAKEEL